MSYSIDKRVTSLSNLSNLLFKAKRPYVDLVRAIDSGSGEILSDARVKALIGDWEIVWGPCVRSEKYERNPNPALRCVPDNVSFVAKGAHEGRDVYVICVAGTNSKSLSENICKQDLKVKPCEMVAWKHLTGVDGGKIALGTSIGMEIVLNKLKCSKQSADPRSLKQWLQQTTFAPNSEMITAGHSLGAAISSGLAVWLADTKSSVWNGAEVNVSAYPTAGPTIGDKEWAEHAMIALKGRFYGRYSSLDAVARAWDKIDEVGGMYAEYGLKPKIPVKTGIKLLARLVHPVNPYHRCAGWTMFEGTYNPNAPGKDRTPFMNQIMYQHLPGYIDPLGYREYYDLAASIFPQPVDPR